MRNKLGIFFGILRYHIRKIYFFSHIYQEKKNRH
jgi:hypothetical protein